MTRDNTYWRHRAAQRMFEHMQSAEEISDQIAKLYLKASRYLSVEMQGIFEKYMTKHSLTEKEALQLINTLQDKTSLNELLQKLQAAEDSEIKKRLITELEAPAYQARIDRFQQLQNQLDQVMQYIYRQEKQFSTKHYVDLANEAYYRSMFDIQQQAGLGFSFSHVDSKQIDRVVDSKWSGKNYSSRIWGNTQALAQDLKEELLINLITGRTEREVAQILANKFAKGASTARRLVRTESCYLSNQMEMQSYKECGIDTYIYVATLDLRTCDDCCAPLDGRRFPVAEQQPGKNCPPMHPWCRCTTIAFVSESSFARMKRRAWNPEKKETELVPASMNYQEWYEKYIEKASKGDIIELQRKKDNSRSGLKFISDERFNELTIAARKKGAVIIRGTQEAEEHLEKLDAAASNIGDILIFRKDVCVSEVLEEVHHFEQNLAKMNNSKGEPLRSILNEIDAKQYLLDNANKFKIPRNEIDLTKKQLRSYQKQLEEYKKGE